MPACQQPASPEPGRRPPTLRSPASADGCSPAAAPAASAVAPPMAALASTSSDKLEVRAASCSHATRRLGCVWISGALIRVLMAAAPKLQRGHSSRTGPQSSSNCTACSQTCSPSAATLHRDRSPPEKVIGELLLWRAQKLSKSRSGGRPQVGDDLPMWAKPWPRLA